MQHTSDEANALTQSNEANHHGNDNGKQTNDLVKNTGQHGAGHDAGQSGGGSNDVLKAALLSQKICTRVGKIPWLRATESNCHLKIQSLACDLYTSPRYENQKKIRKNL